MKLRLVLEVNNKRYTTKVIDVDLTKDEFIESLAEVFQKASHLTYELENGDRLLMFSNAISNAVFLVEEVDE